ncbi:MAG TPA: hypothetical protein VN281_02460 [Verrucomicrobiae bacterium]|nr:hypothetical protein [Verrucomicrobiae bacterium]
MDLGIIGALVGTIIGVLGGIIGTYVSIRNARLKSERRYMIWCAVGFTLGIGLFLGGMLLASEPYRLLLWIPYLILLPMAIRACNRGQAKFLAGHRRDDRSQEAGM